jgi:L-asparagine oxygenase
MAVVRGQGAGQEICFDAHYLSTAAGDNAAAEALDQLRGALDRAQRAHELTRGDLIILDNRRVVHARSPFTARYDGTDRWLMRTMVCASIPHYRCRSQRIINSL